MLLEQEKLQAGHVAEEEARQSRPAEPPVSDGEEKPAKNPNRIYLHQDRALGEQRIVVEFPFDRAKVNARQAPVPGVGWP